MKNKYIILIFIITISLLSVVFLKKKPKISKDQNLEMASTESIFLDFKLKNQTYKEVKKIYKNISVNSDEEEAYQAALKFRELVKKSPFYIQNGKVFPNDDNLTISEISMKRLIEGVYFPSSSSTDFDSKKQYIFVAITNNDDVIIQSSMSPDFNPSVFTFYNKNLKSLGLVSYDFSASQYVKNFSQKN